MILHRSIKADQILWRAAEDRAKEKGFASTNSYIRFLIQEDVAGSSEDMEARLVASMSQMSARMQSIGTMSQAEFAAIWTLIELVLSALPAARPGTTPAIEARLNEVRLRIAGDVRRNPVLTELIEEKSIAATTQTAGA